MERPANPVPVNAPAEPAARPHLERGMGLGGAVALNMLDMIGVGPFITIPLIVAAMGGPQAMLGWILGALLALCDGLVSAELGASMPRAGGPYEYLKQIYGASGLGRLISFLFIWQLSFSAPLSIATGCIGLADYASYLFPPLRRVWFQHTFALPLPLAGAIQAHVAVTAGTLAAIGVCGLAMLLLYRNISGVGRVTQFLCGGVLLTVAWIVFAGVTHFDAHRAFSFPPGAFRFSTGFFLGLGGALLISIYDYWGYYNICYLGGEVRDPERNIPRAVIYSILAVAAIYIVMNVSLLGVVPWREMLSGGLASARLSVVSVMMQRIYGAWAADAVTLLIIWTAFGSIFSLLLGYSRVPYAAALDGNFFKSFQRLHPRHKFPHVSLVAMGLTAMAFCFFQLAQVIAALVVIRVLLQFSLQQFGLLWLRWKHPETPRPFRMWLYPIPVVVAIIGFLYVVVSRHAFGQQLFLAIAIAAAGVVLYLWRALRRREWPFAGFAASDRG